MKNQKKNYPELDKEDVILEINHFDPLKINDIGMLEEAIYKDDLFQQLKSVIMKLRKKYCDSDKVIKKLSY